MAHEFLLHEPNLSFSLLTYVQISYDSVGLVQMRFLRLLSDHARQNFTYTCINSVGWYDDRTRSYEKAIRFLGDNDDEFSSEKNTPTVEYDGCRVC